MIQSHKITLHWKTNIVKLIKTERNGYVDALSASQNEEVKDSMNTDDQSAGRPNHYQ